MVRQAVVLQSRFRDGIVQGFLAHCHVRYRYGIVRGFQSTAVLTPSDFELLTFETTWYIAEWMYCPHLVTRSPVLIYNIQLVTVMELHCWRECLNRDDLIVSLPESAVGT